MICTGSDLWLPPGDQAGSCAEVTRGPSGILFGASEFFTFKPELHLDLVANCGREHTPASQVNMSFTLENVNRRLFPAVPEPQHIASPTCGSLGAHRSAASSRLGGASEHAHCTRTGPARQRPPRPTHCPARATEAQLSSRLRSHSRADTPRTCREDGRLYQSLRHRGAVSGFPVALKAHCGVCLVA
ncbi:Glycerol-3-Phosphate Dehydrogenase [Nad(+)], Cytoplasmic [Manis pentadactyla]|nr:Glycerol-3-Phosphate Dehydrogenase [Nad(+)], Cytoplasmic [Manis pentadactyla]